MRKYSKIRWLIALITSCLLFTNCGGFGGSSSSDGSSGVGSSGGGVELSNEYSSLSELGVGDIMFVNFDSGSASVDFSDVSSSAEFIMVVGSAYEGETSGSVAISADIADLVTKDMASLMSEEVDERDYNYTADDILSAWLRAAEFELSLEEPVYDDERSVMKASSVYKAASLGELQSFRVLSSLTSTSSYTTVEGEVRCVGDNVIVFVDTDVSSANLSDSDVEELCAVYDNSVEYEQGVFGESSDVDGDDKVHILMTKQINRLGEMGGGIITGYFYAADLYPLSGSNPVSNYRDIVYTMVPDPDGDYGYAISNDFAMSNLLKPVFAHELQHLINYNQRVLEGGGTAMSNWLNEGLSHLAEDLVGQGQENSSRIATFLGSTASTSLVASGQPSLQERAASYLLLRFLYEQSDDGEAFIGRMHSSSATDAVDIIEDAFNGTSGFSTFTEFMARWTVAMAVTNRGVTSDPRYIYEDRTLDSSTGNWKGVCLICDADDGRGTALEGVTMTSFSGSAVASVYGSAARYYDEVRATSPELNFTGSSSADNFAVFIRTE